MGVRFNIQICALMGFFGTSNDTLLRAFRDNISIPPSKVKKSKTYWHLTIGSTGCSETSVTNYNLRFDKSQKSRSHLHCGRSLMSCLVLILHVFRTTDLHARVCVNNFVTNKFYRTVVHSVHSLTAYMTYDSTRLEENLLFKEVWMHRILTVILSINNKNFKLILIWIQ
jgi:hypothetical protein